MKNCIKQLRAKAELSQGDLAQILGVSRQTISYLESGKQEPSLVLALTLAHVFRCPVEDIFQLEKEDMQKMRDIEAIPTNYRGISFRSRREARWAVFWDALEVQWQYEPPHHQLPSGNYLPDFLLPELRIWVEIKPDLKFLDEYERQRAIKRCYELAIESDHTVLLYYGDVINPSESLETIYSNRSAIFFPVRPYGSPNPDDAYHFDNVCWHICSECGWVDLGNDQLAGIEHQRAPYTTRKCRSCHEGNMLAWGNPLENPYLQKLFEAYSYARKYVF